MGYVGLDVWFISSQIFCCRLSSEPAMKIIFAAAAQMFVSSVHDTILLAEKNVENVGCTLNAHLTM